MWHVADVLGMQTCFEEVVEVILEIIKHCTWINISISFTLFSSPGYTCWPGRVLNSDSERDVHLGSHSSEWRLKIGSIPLPYLTNSTVHLLLSYGKQYLESVFFFLFKTKLFFEWGKSDLGVGQDRGCKESWRRDIKENWPGLLSSGSQSLPDCLFNGSTVTGQIEEQVKGHLLPHPSS